MGQTNRKGTRKKHYVRRIRLGIAALAEKNEWIALLEDFCVASMKENVRLRAEPVDIWRWLRKWLAGDYKRNPRGRR